jgi:hypothetical protein
VVTADRLITASTPIRRVCMTAMLEAGKSACYSLGDTGFGFGFRFSHVSILFYDQDQVSHKLCNNLAHIHSHS